MSKFDLFEMFYQRSAVLGIKSIIVVLLASCILASVIAITYYLTNRHASYNSKFNAQLVLLTLIAGVIMMLISSNIIISLGMVGALSIIRFRSAMKDSRDTVYIFWAITAGLCSGCQSFKLAFVSTLFISLILLGLARLPIFWHKYMLVVTGSKKQIDAAALGQLLKSHTLWHKMRTATKAEDTQELIFELNLKEPAGPDLLDQITNIDGVTSANLVSQQADTIG